MIKKALRSRPDNIDRGTAPARVNFVADGAFFLSVQRVAPDDADRFRLRRQDDPVGCRVDLKPSHDTLAAESCLARAPNAQVAIATEFLATRMLAGALRPTVDVALNPRLTSGHTSVTSTWSRQLRQAAFTRRFR
jgi:hypothetical protein